MILAGAAGLHTLYRFDSKIHEDDVVVEKNSARVVVDGMSIDFLKGAEIDYSDDMIRIGFVIEKIPNADAKCHFRSRKIRMRMHPVVAKCHFRSKDMEVSLLTRIFRGISSTSSLRQG